ncbi:MAG: tandem-95 repeat protein [Sedimentisphaerales bacterium]|nr:tandem-95 repeat protein [Sedimentisphaerales bacterium]
MKRALIISALLIVLGIGIFGGIFHTTNSPPTASDDSISTQEDTPAAITLKCSDSDGDLLSLIIENEPSHGTLSGKELNLIYVPERNFSGIDSFTYKVNDGKSESNSAAVSIVITPVNDPPTAVDDIIEILEDVSMIPINVLDNDTDADNDQLTILGAIGGSQGDKVINNDNNQIIYTPNKNFSGSDSFSYTISDGQGGTNTGTVRIKITPINDKPVIRSKAPAPLIRFGNKFVYDVDARDSDPEDTLIYSLTTKPEGMTIDSTTGLIEWDPGKEQIGVYNIQVEVTDDSNKPASDTQTFTLALTSPDSPISQLLKVEDGYNSQTKKNLLSEGIVPIIEESDNKWHEIQGGAYISCSFADIYIPSGAVISSVSLSVEHFESRGFPVGYLQWSIGTGWPDKPDVWYSISAPIHEGQTQESADSWEITTFVDTPEKINSFQLQVNNTNNITSRKASIDNIYLIVKWY